MLPDQAAQRDPRPLGCERSALGLSVAWLGGLKSPELR